jgi:molecular chaperone DnaK
MYNASQEAGAQPGAEANGNPQVSTEGGNVTDVDFEEVKEDKK